MKSSIFIGKRAISPATATIILVAVTFVVAVSSTFYYTSAVGAYTDFEKVEVRSVKAYPVSILKKPTNNIFKGSGWNVSINIKNDGTKDTEVNRILLNGKPLDVYSNLAVFDGSGYVKTGTVSFEIPSRSSIQIFIAIKSDEDKTGGVTFSSGSHIEITLQSISGNSYMQFVWLT